MTNPRETMLKCVATNLVYMRGTPASRQGYRTLVRLYERLARESLHCVRAWVEDKPCPPHEPATSAFWWGVATWAAMFTTDVVGWAAPPWENLLRHEVQEFFTRPHIEFARWLRPVRPEDRVDKYQYARSWRSPGMLILENDVAWTQSVIRLTARWGLRHHLKDLLALGQALLLMRRLRRGPGDSVARAYLEADLAFLQELFGHFDFSPDLRGVLHRFLVAAAKQTGQN